MRRDGLMYMDASGMARATPTSSTRRRSPHHRVPGRTLGGTSAHTGQLNMVPTRPPAPPQQTKSTAPRPWRENTNVSMYDRPPTSLEPYNGTHIHINAGCHVCTEVNRDRDGRRAFGDAMSLVRHWCALYLGRSGRFCAWGHSRMISTSCKL
jgi:hypothetical protein